ncbi:hypothetical protein F5Y16DRAFT_398628 [Xylariaceae sp. FL0255]|nr:hypothetical protein F5Y16DRAFT_398628 [Xylariaceae sp. FL0255]
MMSALLDQGVSPDITLLDPRIPILHALIASRAYEYPRIGPIAFMLFYGSNPRFDMEVGQQLYFFDDRKGRKFAGAAGLKVVFRTTYPSTHGNKNAVNYWRNLGGRPQDATNVLILWPETERLLEKHGWRRLSLRALVEIWYPDHYSVLQQAIDFILEVDADLCLSQRVELQRRFGNELRRLFGGIYPHSNNGESLPRRPIRRLPLALTSADILTRTIGPSRKITWEEFELIKKGQARLGQQL